MKFIDRINVNSTYPCPIKWFNSLRPKTRIMWLNKIPSMLRYIGDKGHELEAEGFDINKHLLRYCCTYYYVSIIVWEEKDEKFQIEFLNRFFSIISNKSIFYPYVNIEEYLNEIHKGYLSPKLLFMHL